MLWLENDVFVGDTVHALVDADEGLDDDDVDLGAEVVLCIVTNIATMPKPVFPAGNAPERAKSRPSPPTYRVTIAILYGPLMGLHFTRQMALGEVFHIKLGFSDEEMRGEDLRQVFEDRHRLGIALGSDPLRRFQASYEADAEGDSDSDSDSGLSSESSDSDSGDGSGNGNGSVGAGARAGASGRDRRIRKRRRTADELAKIESYSDPRVAEMAEMSAGGRKTRSQYYAFSGARA